MIPRRRRALEISTISRARRLGFVVVIRQIPFPQSRFVILAAVIDADDIHGVARNLEQNRHTSAKPQRSQARSKIVAP